MEDHFTSGTFRVWSEDNPVALVLHVTGELDLMTAPSLRVRFQQLIGRDRPIVVDFSELQYLDMAGLHALEDCHQQAKHEGQRVLLVGSSPLVHKILAIVQLNERVPAVGTMEEALKAIEQRDGDVS